MGVLSGALLSPAPHLTQLSRAARTFVDERPQILGTSRRRMAKNGRETQ